jgi:hypothetical protein
MAGRRYRADAAGHRQPAVMREGGEKMAQLGREAAVGTDAWSREVRRVRELATRLGLALDEEDLVLLDVREQNDGQIECTL